MNWKIMRRTGLCLLCALALLCGLTLSAAAGEKELSVQLNGEPVAFTDAYPENRNNRNFLPFRAVFDALGAEVSYNDYTHTATAVRGDTTVDVPIGTDKVIVTRNGQREVLTMDVCSYVKGGRTYVPVRFMAQALGCLVEWDQANVTIILIDMEKLTEQAMEGRKYTLLDGSRALLERYGSGSWSVEGQMEYALAVGENVLMTTLAQYHGLTGGAGQSQLFLTVVSDHTLWYQAQAAALGLTLEELGLDEGVLCPVMELEIRADTAAETSYLYVTRADGAEETLPLNTWIAGASATQVSGVELPALNETGSGLDAAALIRTAVEELVLTDSATAMEQARTCAFELAYKLSDTAASALEGGRGISWTVCGTYHTLLAAEEETGGVTAVLWEQSGGANGISMLTQTVADAEGNVAVTVAAEGNSQTVRLTENGRYTPTEEQPQTALPEGVEAVSVES